MHYTTFFSRLRQFMSGTKSHARVQPVMVMGERTGYVFFCPGCERNHFFPTTVSDAEGRRWIFNGDVVRPSFTPAQRMEYEYEDRRSDVCHLWVSHGMLDFLDDCTHRLRGKIIPMREIS